MTRTHERRLAEQHAFVGDDSDRVASRWRIRHERLAVALFERVDSEPSRIAR